jgi:shikimate kinase
MEKTNVILIGMPGAGKSSVGRALARKLGLGFHDTDEGLVARHGAPLQELIDQAGLEAFQRLEERYVLDLRFADHVIATGGSVVYSEPAMRSMATEGVVVYLDLSLEELTKRLTDFDTRGIVMEPLEDLEGLYRRRAPLYRRWADITIEADGLDEDHASAEIVGLLNQHPDWPQGDARP